jgi:heme exporter protein D
MSNLYLIAAYILTVLSMVVYILSLLWRRQSQNVTLATLSQNEQQDVEEGNDAIEV